MTPQEFAKALSFLGAAYMKEITRTTAETWYMFFADETVDAFQKAAARVAEKSRFFPTIAELKEELAKIEHPEAAMTADSEWARVMAAIRRYGFYQIDKAKESLPMLTQEAVRRIGGLEAICRGEEYWMRKAFSDVFDGLKDEWHAAAIHGSGLRLETEQNIAAMITKNWDVKAIESKEGDDGVCPD